MSNTNRTILDSCYDIQFDTPATHGELHTRYGGDTVRGDIYDAASVSPSSRRPPSAFERRSVSPCNATKPFAEARRQTRDNIDGTVSVTSQHRNHEFTSLAADNSLGGEVYSPKGEGHQGKNSLFDLDYLENLVEPETRRQSAIRVFPSLLPADVLPNSACKATSDGEFINILPDKAFISKTKAESPNIAIPRDEEAERKRFSFFSSSLESTIHAAEFNGLHLPGETVQDLFSLTKEEDNGVWWLNMNNPTEQEIQIISKAFGIHPLTIEDIITQETREKIELFPSYYFSCFRSFRNLDQPAGTDYIPFNMYVVVFREGTLSFSFADDAHATRVQTRISSLKEYVSLSSDWICYALINDIVDSFAPVVSKLESEAEALEEQRFIARPDDNWTFLQRISMARKHTTGLMRLLGGKADVLRGFTKRCTENYKVTPHMDIALYLGDIQDHVVTMMNSLIHVEEMLSRSHRNYLAQLSIDRITQGNQVNKLLTRVTVLATVLVPLVVITGIFGMNIEIPWKNERELNAWFGIVGGIILFAVACTLTARRIGYI
ncbi:hypothetical protein NW768_008586 [Fusarium equiseti]|uniref:Uncharacterized protein n=1 Tax=Fusarium equiseti TaxID=61235 RepID=A0ABQ8R4T0_FUSEQ|nr:hypothetical protein NW768_008586 [Fusarium equiseti]